MWKFKGDSRGKRPVKDQGDSVGRLIRRMTRDMILLLVRVRNPTY